MLWKAPAQIAAMLCAPGTCAGWEVHVIVTQKHSDVLQGRLMPYQEPLPALLHAARTGVNKERVNG